MGNSIDDGRVSWSAAYFLEVVMTISTFPRPFIHRGVLARSGTLFGGRRPWVRARCRPIGDRRGNLRAGQRHDAARPAIFTAALGGHGYR